MSVPQTEKIARPPDYGRKFALLAVIFAAAFVTSFMIGRYPIDPVTFVKVLLSHALPADFAILIERTWEDAADTVVMRVRLPRVMAAALIGAALSAAGAAYQGMFRNPMVSPDILGASSGAGFGAALGILLDLGYFGISAAAFLFGLGAVLLAYFIAGKSRINAVLAMVLSGMMVSSVFTSATSFIKLIADTEEVLPAITYWLMGSLASIRGRDTLFLAMPVLPCLLILILLRWRINLLTVGEDEARAMGVNTGRLRAAVILCATLLTASSVAVSGMIGWVGLVIPHFCRMLFGHDYSRLIPASCLFGAAFLIIVDDIARLLATNEIPIGILTSFIGAPVFVWLILKGGAGDDR
ncbi:MAG: iron ABC transporter permease [Clostridiales Family XIII bacterium]|jgi:iron complex transport system permease protein|nr:iron ABC transporter permease [Clostridiales Family XIII bacterium]